MITETPVVENPDAHEIEAGATLFASHCSICHQLTIVTEKRGAIEDWQKIVDKMIMNGAQVSPPEKELIAAYLAANYGPDKSVPATAEH